MQVEECLEPLVVLPAASEAAGVGVAFAAAPHDSGAPRMPLLREGLVVLAGD